MNLTLYFLRSSEQKIVKDMLHFVFKLDEVCKTIDDFTQLEKYYKFYGLTSKDLGLYALVDNTIAGGVWIRLLSDNPIPLLFIGVKPEFREKGIGSAMIEQLILEAGSIYEKVSVTILDNKKTIKYFEKFGFKTIPNSNAKSFINDGDTISMIKELPKDAVIRPSDGYDPTRWMD